MMRRASRLRGARRATGSGAVGGGRHAVALAREHGGGDVAHAVVVDHEDEFAVSARGEVKDLHTVANRHAWKRG